MRAQMVVALGSLLELLLLLVLFRVRVLASLVWALVLRVK